jgi:hypothetical protein
VSGVALDLKFLNEIAARLDDFKSATPVHIMSRPYFGRLKAR